MTLCHILLLTEGLGKYKSHRHGQDMTQGQVLQPVWFQNFLSPELVALPKESSLPYYLLIGGDGGGGGVNRWIRGFLQEH